jgi:uncharacterized protein (UPF0303 family)
MDYKAEYERLTKEEEELTFDSFSREDALNVALIIIEREKHSDRPFGVEILLNGLLVFRYYPEGVTRNNEQWFRRKHNAVANAEMSSLRLTAKAQMEGNTYEDMLLDRKDYAWGGGGYPLRVKNTGLVGSICVSGLTGEEDHQIIVDALRAYKG